MAVGRTRAVSLLGIQGALVEVEAAITQSLPRLVIIGLVDRALGEAEGRVRLAAGNSGCRLPTGRITVNLSPASLPKAGSGFDLAIALACLAADGRVARDSVAGVVHIGELGLDGRLRSTPGVLPAVLAAVRAGHTRVMVPAVNAAEAALVEGAEVLAMPSLRAAALWHGASLAPDPAAEGPSGEGADPGRGGGGPLAAILPAGPHADAEPDLADVIGQPEAVEGIVVAAAGGHHLSLTGPPGAGKSMLAARLPGVLPDLSTEQALEVASVRSLAGLPLGERMPRRPPWESPHHSATAASIIGGGSGLIRPGAAARAAHGVLFLDEAGEFSAHVIDALRQPLEAGSITIHRAIGAATFPGRFQLVIATNPCPCGYFGEPVARCECPPNAVRRYRARLSGPLRDRIDIRLGLRPLSAAQFRIGAEHAAPSTARARDRVEGARRAAARRLANTPWETNAELSGRWLRAPDNAPSRSTVAPLDRALGQGRLSMRGYDRVLRLAWTIADLEGEPAPGPDHVGRALFLREGER